jgi:hypothetical protein
MKFLNFFLILWVIFTLLDLDPDSEFGSTDLIESGSNPNPDPIRIRIRNTAENILEPLPRRKNFLPQMSERAPMRGAERKERIPSK